MRKIGIAVAIVVVSALFVHGLLFMHRYSFLYEFGGLASDPAHFWAGPFTNASLGKSEFEPLKRPLPDVSIHWPDGGSTRLREFRQEHFVHRFPAASMYRTRTDGYTYGRAGDAKFGFKSGVLWHLAYRYKEGWPCFSSKPNSEKYCFPLSSGDAKAVFGSPVSKGRHDIPWI